MIAKRRPTRYDRGQHELICKALKVSDDPDKPGLTAYEAVCIALLKLEMATDAINRTLKENNGLADGENCTLFHLKVAAKEIRKPQEKYTFIPLYGTGGAG